MWALRQRSSAAARASSKSFYTRRYEQKKRVVEGRGAWVVELPRSTWMCPSRPHIIPPSPFSRPMLMLAMRGAKRGATPSTTKPKVPPRPQNKKQHPDRKSTSDLFVRWEIPWSGKWVVITVTAISISFLFSELVIAAVLFGAGYKQGQPLNPDEKSIILFTTLVLQTLVGTAVMKACIKRYSPLPKWLFSYDWRDPFSARRGWLLWGAVGLFCSVAAVQLAGILTNREPFSRNYDVLRHLEPLIGASGTSTALLLAVVGVLTPFWEESVFRGFLLTSLTKWMPTHVAVLLSAGAFALAHFTPAKFPSLFALGVVLGFSYSKTGNLLTPIMIHGVWNSAVILLLIYLHHQGYDIRKVIESEELKIRQWAVETPDCAAKK